MPSLCTIYRDYRYRKSEKTLSNRSGCFQQYGYSWLRRFVFFSSDFDTYLYNALQYMIDIMRPSPSGRVSVTTRHPAWTRPHALLYPKQSRTHQRHPYHFELLGFHVSSCPSRHRPRPGCPPIATSASAAAAAGGDDDEDSQPSTSGQPSAGGIKGHDSRGIKGTPSPTLFVGAALTHADLRHTAGAPSWGAPS